ncbi:MAG: hypothetical protein J0H65_00395 [Rhizobiales bacterium]|nr:hypothetical protein [Hyphomicrobiales bacterium]
MKEECRNESEIQKELNRRLDLVLHDGYGDPARADISRWELVLWFCSAIGIAIATATMMKSGI